METFIRCPVCKQAYNLEDREPKLLIPCGHQMCQKCVSGLSSEQQPQNLLCPQGRASPELIQQIAPNTHLIEELKKNFGIFIYCEAHQNKPAEFLNKQKQILICSKCALLEKERDQLEEFDEQAIVQKGKVVQDLAKRNEEIFEKAKIRLANYQALGSDIIEQMNSYSGSQVLKQLAEAQLYLESLQKNFGQEEQKYHSKLKTGLRQSLIVGTNEIYLSLLKLWIDKKFKETKLLYRGSQDDYLFDVFHQKCDGKGPTLVIVQTVDDYIFGGFTSQNWDCQKTKWIDDQEAFSFSLTRQTKHPMKPDYSKATLSCDKFLIVIGYGPDIAILHNPNKNTQSYSMIGKAMQPPYGIEYSTDNSKMYMAGKNYFQVKELEIFQVMT